MISLSWWHYNPIYQKPTTLEAVQPYQWYWYYGPDPAAGVSYGQYEDSDNDFSIVTKKGDKVFSPVSGKEMEFVSDVSSKEVEGVMALSTSGKGTMERTSCSSCQARLVSTVSMAKAAVVHCCCCGNRVKAAKICESFSNERVKTMSIEKSRLDQVKGLRAKVKANLLAKEATAGIKRLIKAKSEDKEEWVSLDTIQKALAEVEEEEALLEKEAMLEKEDEDSVSLDDLMSAMNAVSEEEAAESEEEEEEEAAESEEPAEAPPAAEAPPPAQDEYMDLDMVLSTLNKREAQRAKMEATKRAEVRARMEKRKKAQAAYRLKAEEEKKEDLAEAEEEKEESSSEEASEEAAEKAEPNMVSEENPLPAPAAEAMKFEPLASFSALKGIKRDQIDMSLFGDNSENPTWHVTVAGVPTARIQLKAQASAEDIRDVFVSDDYAFSLIDHCEKSGFVETMNKVNAEFWANFTSNKKVAARFEASAEKKYSTEYKKTMASFRNDFINCLNIVNAGMNKNFYPEIGNPLKGSLFANLTMVGLPEQTATAAIEKAFAEGAADYFNSLFEKSQEYMDLSPVVRSEMAKAITRANTVNIDNDALASAEPATLGERMARASATAMASAGSAFQVRAQPLSIDADDYKRQLKAVFPRNAR
jgi:chemotaxis protein histidine kinase CheA